MVSLGDLCSIIKGKQEKLTSITYTLTQYIKSNPHDEAAKKALERYQDQLKNVNVALGLAIRNSVNI